MFGLAKHTDDDHAEVHDSEDTGDAHESKSNQKSEPLENMSEIAPEVVEAAEPVLKLALVDLAIKTGGQLVKVMAEHRVKRELEQVLGKKAARAFDSRSKLARRAAFSVVRRPLPLLIVAGGVAGGVIWYRHAKAKRDERREAASQSTQTNASGETKAGSARSDAASPDEGAKSGKAEVTA